MTKQQFLDAVAAAKEYILVRVCAVCDGCDGVSRRPARVCVASVQRGGGGGEGVDHTCFARNTHATYADTCVCARTHARLHTCTPTHTHHQQSGDIFQLVLSQRYERRTFASPFEVYRALRVVNPSPYMVYMQARGCIIVSSSPEILCRCACCVLRAACCVLCAVCCVLRAACCVLRAACCVLCAACCVLRAACCVLCAVCCVCGGACVPQCCRHAARHASAVLPLASSMRHSLGHSSLPHSCGHKGRQ
jgi:hypothetical protein